MEKSQIQKAAKTISKVDDPELNDLIHKFDYTPSSELKFNVNEHMSIYNYLKELELYRKLCGPLNKV